MFGPTRHIVPHSFTDSMKRPILLPFLALLLVSGCTSLVDSFSPSVAISPEAWVPRMADGDEVDADTEVTVRPIRRKDAIIVNITVALRPQPRIEDIVNDEGNITLPDIGSFRIEGLTTADAERAIRQTYIDRGVYIDPTVSVICVTRDPAELKFYYITGAVRSRKRCPLIDGMRLQQAIIEAGDVTDFASNKVLIKRRGIIQQYNYRRIKKGLDPDPLIRPGDIIEVLE